MWNCAAWSPNYLSREGFEVIPSHTGEEGVAEAQRHEYAIAIIDVVVPQINGFEVLRRIRTRSRTPAPYLIDRSQGSISEHMFAIGHISRPVGELIVRLSRKTARKQEIQLP
jgi:DNA-binding response OmpR family regulator